MGDNTDSHEDNFEDTDLSDEERAAIDEGDPEAEEESHVDVDTEDDGNGEADQNEAAKEGDTDEGEAEKGDMDDEPDPDDKADPADPAESADETTTKDDATDPNTDPDPKAVDPPPADEPPSDKAALQAQLKELKTEWEAGELDYDDYEERRDKLRDEIRDIDTRESIRREIAIAEAEKAWKQEQAEFFKDNPAILGSDIVYDAFAREVNKLLADKAWTAKPGAELLSEARVRIEKAFGSQGPDTVRADKKQGKQSVKAAKRASADRESAPRTLRDVPADEGNTGGRFEHLDRLADADPAAYERAVAKLTPEEWDEYSRA